MRSPKARVTDDRPLHLGIRLVIAILCVALPMGTATADEKIPLAGEQTVAVDAYVQGVLQQQSENTIVPGVTQRKYTWKRYNGDVLVTTAMQTLTADLQHPFVRLDTLTGVNGQFTQKATVLKMAREAGAIAAINGDFYNTQAEGAPLGPQVTAGNIVSTPTPFLEGMYTFGIMADKTPRITRYSFFGTVTARNGSTFPLTGVNKTYGTYDGKHTHANALHLYTTQWGGIARGNDGATTPTEVLVVDNIVQNIRYSGTFSSLIPPNGYILRASGAATVWVTNHVRIGEPLTYTATIRETTSDAPAVPMTPDTSETPPAENAPLPAMLIGGHTILLEEGKRAPFSRSIEGVQGNSATARTAIGYDQSGRYVTMVVVDHTKDSVGVTLPQLQQLLLSLNVWRAVNLDGGGSSTFVSRPVGETVLQLSNNPKDGTARKVVNGIGLFYDAPQGQQTILTLDAPTTLWKGQQAIVRPLVHDEHGNPLPLVAPQLQFDSTGVRSFIPAPQGKNSVVDGVTSPVMPEKNSAPPTKNDVVATPPPWTIIATQAGAHEGTVTANGQTVRQRFTVQEGKDIASLQLFPALSPDLWKSGQPIPLQAIATGNDGKPYPLPLDLLTWEFHGIKAKVVNDTLVFEAFSPDAKQATIVATYDQFTTVYAIPLPTRQALSLQQPYPFMMPVNSWGAPHTVPKMPVIASETIAKPKMTYRMDVQGDGKPAQLRAYFKNTAGEMVNEPVIQNIASSKIRTVTFTYEGDVPATLEAIDVVEPPENTMPSSTRTITIHRLSRVQEEFPPPTPYTIALTIDKKDSVVNDTPKKLEEPPRRFAGTTYVPVRFVVDALGGVVQWDSVQKKITIRQNAKHLTMWVQDTTILRNGTRLAGEHPPKVINGRTLLPLRTVAQQLGMRVQWDAPTRRIVLQQ